MELTEEQTYQISLPNRASYSRYNLPCYSKLQLEFESMEFMEALAHQTLIDSMGLLKYNLQQDFSHLHIHPSFNVLKAVFILLTSFFSTALTVRPG